MLYGKTRVSCEVNFYGRSLEQVDCALTSLFIGDPTRPLLARTLCTQAVSPDRNHSKE